MPHPTSARHAAPPRARRLPAYVLLVLLTVLLAVWGSFLVPLRIGATPVPVSWALAAGGNLALGRAGARLGGSTGALVPGLVWFALVLVLASRRAEGDVVVPGDVLGTGFLLVGALASAVAYGRAVLRPVVSTE